MDDSIFTKIIKREIPAKIIFEDNDLIAIEDIDPKAPVHILIIPKRQIPTLNDLDEQDALLMGKIILKAKKLAKEYSIDERGYRLVINCNEEAGQTVFHIHCHLLGGRSMHWPPG
jgi:histidine triad (HIT) family protein